LCFCIGMCVCFRAFFFDRKLETADGCCCCCFVESGEWGWVWVRVWNQKSTLWEWLIALESSNFYHQGGKELQESIGVDFESDQSRVSHIYIYIYRSEGWIFAVCSSFAKPPIYHHHRSSFFRRAATVFEWIVPDLRQPKRLGLRSGSPTQPRKRTWEFLEKCSSRYC
jgi:hypothetical protein